jgi:hypothetical protein
MVETSFVYKGRDFLAHLGQMQWGNFCNIWEGGGEEQVFTLKLGCLHPVACARSGSGSGFPSNATLFEYYISA